MKKNFYQATKKARDKLNLELQYSRLYVYGLMLCISGETLLIVRVHESWGGIMFLTGLIMYLMAKRRTAKLEIY